MVSVWMQRLLLILCSNTAADPMPSRADFLLLQPACTAPVEQSAICASTDHTTLFLLRILSRLDLSVSIYSSLTSPLPHLLHCALVERDLSICLSLWPPLGLGIHAACAAAKGKKKRREISRGRERKEKNNSRLFKADDIERWYAEVKLTLQEDERQYSFRETVLKYHEWIIIY